MEGRGWCSSGEMGVRGSIYSFDVLAKVCSIVLLFFSLYLIRSLLSSPSLNQSLACFKNKHRYCPAAIQHMPQGIHFWHIN